MPDSLKARLRRKPLAIGAAAALLVALIGGFILGRASVGEPKAIEVAERLHAQLEPVRSGLARLPSSGAGTGVEATVTRIETAFEAAEPDLTALDPDGAKELQGAIASLAGAVGGNAPPAQVTQLTQAARSALQRVPGGK